MVSKHPEESMWTRGGPRRAWSPDPAPGWHTYMGKCVAFPSQAWGPTSKGQGRVEGRASLRIRPRLAVTHNLKGLETGVGPRSEEHPWTLAVRVASRTSCPAHQWEGRGMCMVSSVLNLVPLRGWAWPQCNHTEEPKILQPEDMTRPHPEAASVTEV